MKKLALVALLLITVGFFCITKRGHFSTEILLEAHPADLESSFDFDAFNELLVNPLSYIGNGLESVAFVTHDDKYVLKFFLKRQILKKVFFKPKKKFKQLFYNINEICSGYETLKKYRWAHEFLRDETGVLAVHSEKSCGELLSCVLIDYRGKKHNVDLNKVAFIVQKKAKIISQSMLKEEFKIVNLQLRALFSEIARKGFISSSCTFNPLNFATLGGRALMIDVGKLDFAKAVDSYEVEEGKLNERYNSWIDRKLDLF